MVFRITVMMLVRCVLIIIVMGAVLMAEREQAGGVAIAGELPELQEGDEDQNEEAVHGKPSQQESMA